jgi:hypothetical protein
MKGGPAKPLFDAGYRCRLLDSHPDDGIHAGPNWERTLYRRLRRLRQAGNDDAATIRPQT